MRSNLKLSRSVWPWGFTAEYCLLGTLKHKELHALLEKCVNEILPSAFLGSSVEGMKGVDREPPEGESLPLSSGRSMVEEVVFLSGHYASPGEEPESDVFASLGPVQLELFNMYLVTAFKDFPSPGQVRHTVSLVKRGVPGNVGFPSIITDGQALIHHFRLGIEFFDTQFAGEVGKVPVPDQRLMIEATPGRFKVALVAEALKQKTDRPLERDGMFEKVGKMLEELFGFKLADDYAQKLEP